VDVPLGRQLAITQKAVKEWADEILAHHGASLTTWIVLFHADAAEPPGLSQRELAQNMSIGGPALVRHIDRLEAEGLVRRTRDANDRRITRITLTTKGRRRLAKLRVVMADHDRAMREQLSSNEVRVLERALTKLREFVTHPAGTGDDETEVA
jgi:DNA-binding MarR family transcriptional regulator